MNGSIRKRKTKSGKTTYQAVFEEGYSGGKRIRRYQTDPTNRQAEDALSAMCQKPSTSYANCSANIQPNERTVQEVFSEWIEVHSIHIAENTKRGYKNYLEKYIYPHLGALRIQALTASDLNGFYADLRKEGLNGRSVQYQPTNPFASILKKSVKNVITFCIKFCSTCTGSESHTI